MFKGLGNLGNIASMMGSLQSLPEKIQQLNERMKSERVTGQSGCGRVHVTMNGAGEVQAVQMEPGLQGPEAEQAVMEATNQAGASAKEMFAGAITDMTSEMDLNLPGMDGILASLTGR